MSIWKELLEGLFGQPDGGLGATVSAPIAATGCDTAAERQARVAKLLNLQEQAVNNPSWRPTPDGRTYCNRGLNFIAQGMGYFFPASELADDMIMHMASDPRWRQDSLDRARDHAMNGGLAVAALIDHPHGHVCTFAPLSMEESTSWGGLVPMVANVGKDNGIMRISGAFTPAERPRVAYFLLALEDA